MSLFELRHRQIHLDFHTSPLIEGVGAGFDAEEFASTLERAHVNSVTCFARCHHGMIYYDSKMNPERVHPHLMRRNLLGEQIAACHRRGIRVPIYTTVQWDYYTAKQHPEWLCRNADGAVYGSPEEKLQKPFDPGFYHSLCVNTPYRDFLKAHVREILETFAPVDGLFLDIVFSVPCACEACQAGMKNVGLKPHREEDRERYARSMIDGFKRDLSAFIRSIQPEATIFYNNGHIGSGHPPVLDAYSHLELESLPSGIWGYLHFPATVRYARTLGTDFLAQTGKFHTMWGDFHSFKNPEALQFETFQMMLLNAKCLIGDQLEPSGRLSPPVYDLIGSAYSEIERKEPWCRQTRALTDIGVLSPEEFFGASAMALPYELRGAVRMLQESSQMFDVLDSRSDFSKYRVLVLPDVIPVSPTLAARLQSYLDQGGAVIASFESGMDPAGEGFTWDALGVRARPDQTLDITESFRIRGVPYPRADYAEYLLPRGALGRGLPPTELAMYMKGVTVDALPGTEVLVETVASVFDRTYEHFCSHRQSPSSGKVQGPGIVRRGRVVYFSHPLFRQYNQNAPRWCKQLFLNALELFLPEPLLRHGGPSTLMTSVNEQAAEKRWVVHLLHYIPERRSLDIDVIEDVIPVYRIDVSVRSEAAVRSVSCVPGAIPLPFSQKDGRVEFQVPEVIGHQMIELKF